MRRLLGRSNTHTHGVTIDEEGGGAVLRHGRALVALALATATVGAACVGPAPQAQAKPTVSVWLTTKDGANKLARQPDIAFGSGGDHRTITIDPGTTYQTMEGFGASLTDSSAWLINNAPKRDEIMTRLFDSEAGIGLTSLRQVIGASDFARTFYSYDDVPEGETDYDLSEFSLDHDRADILPLARRARQLSPQLSVLATPWSPPAWMKTNGSLVGGELAPRNYQVYADYLVRFVQEYQQAGVPVAALTSQNEPLPHSATYPSTSMSADAQAAFIGNDLGPKLEAAGLDTAILAYDHNWDHPEYPKKVLADSEAAKYVDGSAFHCYRGAPDAQTDVHDAHPDKGIFLTECTGIEYPDDPFGTSLMRQARKLVIDGTRNWAKTVIMWNMALDPEHGPHADGSCDHCTGVTTVDNDTGEVGYNAEYYTLGHASKFVRPGAVRIGSNTFGDSGVTNVAFRNTDGSTALIALNDTEAEQTFTVSWQGDEFDYTLPAGSLATFTWPPA